MLCVLQSTGEHRYPEQAYAISLYISGAYPSERVNEFIEKKFVGRAPELRPPVILAIQWGRLELPRGQ
jgi:hypothetical protein